jgi:uncharacterized protein YbcV (DUF1398 family)
MNTQLLSATLARSMKGEIAFPEVVGVMMAEGVESYHADLVRQEETFYARNGETHVERMHISPLAIADEFSGESVVSAIRASQAGESKYPEFLDRVTKAGTTNYVVYLDGRRCIYFGRKGEFHVEEFRSR